MLLKITGTAFPIIGGVGIILPLLPTTPFLMLAAVCYARSSERWYRRLLTNRWFGEYIRNWHEGRGIPMKTKILSIAFLS
ncbi:MAG: YbaN family protein [Euryarchaeota archaeon]|nr:YbaN family protein [Euryarchaeota archaeon]